MKLTVLIENTTLREDFAREHGLSLYLETQGRKILFDAGQSGAFAENAGKLGIDLGTVELAVLSHGHYDHGGGLARFLEINDHSPIFVSSHAFEPHYNAAGKEIGLDPDLEKSCRLVSVQGTRELAQGLWLHALDVPPADTSGLTVMKEGIQQPEDFRHEQYLLLEEKGKRILISGCSHKGILNIMEAFRPDVLIGGFHFMKIQQREILEEFARKLLEYPTIYYTGHCTGEAQFAVLKDRMGSRLHALSTGAQFEI